MSDQPRSGPSGAPNSQVDTNPSNQAYELHDYYSPSRNGSSTQIPGNGAGAGGIVARDYYENVPLTTPGTGTPSSDGIRQAEHQRPYDVPAPSHYPIYNPSAHRPNYSIDISDGGSHTVDPPGRKPRSDSISTANSRTALGTSTRTGVPPLPTSVGTGTGSGVAFTNEIKSSKSHKPGLYTYGPRTADDSDGDPNNEKFQYHTPPPLSRKSSGNLLNNSSVDHNHAGGSNPYRPVFNASDSNTNLMFAEGDFIPPTKLGKIWLRILNSSIIIRWIIFIVPFLGLLWIPGIIGLTADKTATVWSVQLVWWSAWLSVVWVGWWAAMAAGMIAPFILKATIGIIIPGSRHYIDYVASVTRYLSIFLWALAIWISFQPLVQAHGPNSNSDGNGHTLHQIVQGLFGIVVDAAILLGEKLVVQVVSYNFHKLSYEDRISEQKFQIKTLATLYVNSHDIGRSDTLDQAFIRGTKKPNPKHALRQVARGVRKVAQTTTTALGTVASEIAGERVLQPNSPISMVTAALSSSNKSRQLARRIFFSFVPSYRQVLVFEDMAKFFPTREEAEEAFAVFDRDGNGDATLEEIELACLEVHRERIALSSSMRDLDGAVRNIDGILMSLYYVIAILVIIGLLDVSFTTLLASAGSLVLGLSWLLGASAQEVLASVIFLLIKHPYDVSDRVDVDGDSYVVKEMNLLSTVFRKPDGKIVQIPHSVLNAKAVTNIRRSGPISETFEFDVDFGTTFEQIQDLRSKMLAFLEEEKRDFLPQIDIAVKDFAGQGKMTLSADIKYKSNWQNGTLKAQRRNKWICALKLSMAAVEMWGPSGAGNPSPPLNPTHIKMLPHTDAQENQSAGRATPPSSERTESQERARDELDILDSVQFGDRNQVLEDVTFDERTVDEQPKGDPNQGLRSRGQPDGRR